MRGDGLPTAEELDEWDETSMVADEHGGVVIRELPGDLGGGEEVPAIALDNSLSPRSSAGGLLVWSLSDADCPDAAQRGCGLFFS